MTNPKTIVKSLDTYLTHINGLLTSLDSDSAYKANQNDDRQRICFGQCTLKVAACRLLRAKKAPTNRIEKIRLGIEAQPFGWFVIPKMGP